MLLLDTLSVYYGSEERRIGIYDGDLTELTPEEAVDVLVVSAFPGDYAPTPGSLIGALDDKGVSVDELARDKATDLRDALSCWISREIESADPGIRFRRILCFEPYLRGSPPEVVGDIFRSLGALMGDDPSVHSVAMPLVATGDQRTPTEDMIEPLLDAAVHWMAVGLPLTELKIAARSARIVEELAREFSRLKQRYLDFSLAPRETAYDLFVSYSHTDAGPASIMVEELQRLSPGLRIFFDRLTLDTGAAWQQEVYEAIDASRRFLSLFSPSYLKSKICLEEFNIALYRRRENGDVIVFPVYVYSAALPSYMGALVNYEDCREGDAGKLRAACRKLLAA